MDSVWDAFRTGQNTVLAPQAAQMQQAGGAVGILQHLQQQEMQRNQMMRDAQMRSEVAALGPNPEPKALEGVILKFGGTEGLLKHIDRQTQIAATKEMTNARIQQAAQQFSSTMDLKIRNETRADVRMKLEQEKAQGMMQFHAEQIRQTGEANKFNFGVPQSTFTAPPITVGAQPAPPPAPGPLSKLLNPAPSGILQAPVPGGNAGLAQRFPAEVAAGNVLAAREGMPNNGGLLPPSSVIGPNAQAAQPMTMPGQMPAAAPESMNVRDQMLSRIAASNAPAAPVAAPIATGAVVAPAAAPAAPALPQMPPEIAKLPGKAQQQWLLQQTKPSMLGAGMLTPEALTLTAQQYLSGDRQAAQGYARSPAMRAALQNEIVAEAQRQGKTGPDIAAKMADFAGIMSGSRSVGVRSAQIELASSEAAKMMDIVEQQSAKFGRTNFVPFNVALKAFETGTGQPEVKAFGAAINSLVNVYARAINPIGIPTIQDKEHAREMLAVIHSPQQVTAVLDILRQEMAAARASPGDVREQLRKAVIGGGSEGTQSRRASDQPGKTIDFSALPK